MSRLFTTVKSPKLGKSLFNLSHSFKFSANMGKLYPIMCLDTVPGDKFKLNTQVFMRMAPMIAPMMSNCKIYTHFFYVPKRILWDKWKDFIFGGDDGLESPVYPYYDMSQYQSDEIYKDHGFYPFITGSLADYLGFPVMQSCNATEHPNVSPEHDDNRFLGGNGTFKCDALPFRAVAMIWNEFFRDQNVQDEIEIYKDLSGKLFPSEDEHWRLFQMYNRAWRKDYFTSALPWAQRGQDVLLPLHGEATLTSDGGYIPIDDNDQVSYDHSYQRIYEGTSDYNFPGTLDVGNTAHLESNDVDLHLGVPRNGDGEPLYSVDPSEIARKVGVDLTNASAATINELRRAFAAQRFLEARARGGGRYPESLLSIFGVRSSDATLQRPVYLGGSAQDIVVSDVLQTSATETGVSPQGNPAGIGASFDQTKSFKYRCEEHGYIIGFLSVIPKAAYQQGLPKQFQKFDRYDHYLPHFAHLGEQEIKNNELYFNPSNTSGDQTKTFGYTPRYAEYKFMYDRIAGDFRETLDFWHLGRIFLSQPGLNSSFITANPSARIFSVTNIDVDKLWFNVQFNLRALRKMPRYGTPKP